jgi:hypothetical protein
MSAQKCRGRVRFTRCVFLISQNVCLRAVKTGVRTAQHKCSIRGDGGSTSTRDFHLVTSKRLRQVNFTHVGVLLRNPATGRTRTVPDSKSYVFPYFRTDRPRTIDQHVAAIWCMMHRARIFRPARPWPVADPAFRPAKARHLRSPSNHGSASVPDPLLVLL